MGTLLFPILILIFFALLLWLVIGCRGWWMAKFWLINISLAFVLVFWSSLNSYLGWPTESEMPETFRFISFFPEEPKNLYIMIDKHGEDKEPSFLEHFNYKSSDTIRLYKLPYNKEMHEKLEAAAERAMKGGYVIGSKGKILDAEQIRNMQKDNNSSQGQLDSGSIGGYLGGLEFYILPPSVFMKKPPR